MKSIFLFILLIMTSVTVAHEEIIVEGVIKEFPGAESLIKTGNILLLGEIHGTYEAPLTIIKIVDKALRNGNSVVVGLEIPVVEQVKIDNFFVGRGSTNDSIKMLSGEFWQKDYQDGRSSRAMMGLIEWLRMEYREYDSQLAVIAMDTPYSAGDRDRFMASRLDSIIKSNPESFVIALTGNVHNRLIKGSHFDGEYESMGYLLKKLNPERNIISLEMANEPGTAWVCTSDGCGITKLGGYGEGIGIELLDNPIDEPYSGYFNVGPINASYPAKDNKYYWEK